MYALDLCISERSSIACFRHSDQEWDRGEKAGDTDSSYSVWVVCEKDCDEGVIDNAPRVRQLLIWLQRLNPI